MDNEDWNRKFKELYDSSFPPVKARYDAVCKIFLDWNTMKIDSETAYARLLKVTQQ